MFRHTNIVRYRLNHGPCFYQRQWQIILPSYKIKGMIRISIVDFWITSPLGAYF